MELTEIFKQCPKAMGKYYEFAGKALKELQQRFLEGMREGVESEVPPLDEGIIKQYGDTILLTNIRSLYTFFDEQGVIMEVRLYPGHPPKYMFAFDGLPSDIFPTREQAEVEGFTKAFQLLEEQLSAQ
jgi:hypothetical protein